MSRIPSIVFFLTLLLSSSSLALEERNSGLTDHGRMAQFRRMVHHEIYQRQDPGTNVDSVATDASPTTAADSSTTTSTDTGSDTVDTTTAAAITTTTTTVAAVTTPSSSSTTTDTTSSSSSSDGLDSVVSSLDSSLDSSSSTSDTTTVAAATTTTTTVAAATTTTTTSAAATSSASSSTTSTKSTSTKGGSNPKITTSIVSGVVVTSTLSSDSSSASGGSASDNSSDASSSSGGLSSVEVAFIVIGSCVVGVFLIWTAIRKFVFSKSKRFNDRMNPIDWGEDHDHDAVAYQPDYSQKTHQPQTSMEKMNEQWETGSGIENHRSVSEVSGPTYGAGNGTVVNGGWANQGSVAPPPAVVGGLTRQDSYAIPSGNADLRRQDSGGNRSLTGSAFGGGIERPMTPTQYQLPPLGQQYPSPPSSQFSAPGLPYQQAPSLPYQQMPYTPSAFGPPQLTSLPYPSEAYQHPVDAYGQPMPPQQQPAFDPYYRGAY